MKLDAIDVKILEELQRDGKITNVDLAQRVGLSASPCLVRVRALEKSGLVAGYVALLNPQALGGLLSVFIQITLERQVEKQLDAFEQAMAALPEVMECYLMTGDSDYLLRVVVPDMQALQVFIVDTLSKIEGVANIRSSFALKQVKYKTEYPVRKIAAIWRKRAELI